MHLISNFDHMLMQALVNSNANTDQFEMHTGFSNFPKHFISLLQGTVKTIINYCFKTHKINHK